MLHATLYLPEHAPRPIHFDDLHAISSVNNFMHIPPDIPALLKCRPELVDVLASGPKYIIYSVFDATGKTNPEAMKMVAQLSGIILDVTNEDEILRGPVIILIES